MNWTQVALIFTLLRSSLCVKNTRFRPDFMFGVSSSAIQIEGGWNTDGKGPSHWDIVNHKSPSRVIDGTNQDVACDSYNKYKEDIAILKAMGVKYYRFSLSWSRILPTGFIDYINPLGIAYYKNLLQELKTNNIEPQVTIHHYDIPEALYQLGGYYNNSFVDWLRDYSKLVFEEFGDDVKWWFTINQPYQMCKEGNHEQIYDGAKILLKAHATVWHLYDDYFRPRYNGKIAMVLHSHWYEPDTNSTEDIAATAIKMQFTWGFFAHPIYLGDWPEIIKTRVALRSQLEGYTQSRLPDLTPEEIDYIKDTNDFLPINIYTATVIKAIPEPPIGEVNITTDAGVYEYQPENWTSTAVGHFKVVPWAMKKLLIWLKMEYGNPLIFITENGYADLTGELQDMDRTNFIMEYLTAIKEAMDENGVQIIGYNYWCLLDSFELLLGYTSKFGLVNVDFQHPNRTRTRKQSSYYYQQICETHCLVDNCVD